MSNSPYVPGSPSDLEWQKIVKGGDQVLPEEPKVDDDEWELGPACGLDPEVCESCQ